MFLGSLTGPGLDLHFFKQGLPTGIDREIGLNYKSSGHSRLQKEDQI